MPFAESTALAGRFAASSFFYAYRQLSTKKFRVRIA
jgi:hypothetical protein